MRPRGRGWSIAFGALAVLAAGAVVADTLLSSEQGGELTVAVTSTAEGMGPGRFLYDQPVTVAATPGRAGSGACLVAFDQTGQWLGEPTEMGEGEGAWRKDLSASELSSSHFGLVWVVVVAGVTPCASLMPLSHVTRGAERPIEALSVELRKRSGTTWGVDRVFVHDKLTVKP